MRILHILDHSVPLQSGYTFRSSAIFKQQRALGWATFHITSPKHTLVTQQRTPHETVDGIQFYRTEPMHGAIAKLPFVDQLSIILALMRRLQAVAKLVAPDILHAHSPALNGAAALAIGRRLNIPTVYEVRGFWEDAAVSHGTSRERGMRYRLTQSLETFVLKRVDAVTCICSGISNDLTRRGVPRDKITIVPNAVDPTRFQINSQRDPDLESDLGLSDRPVIGFIGSFYAYEGLHLLLDAMPYLLQNHPGLKVLLVGGGQELNNLKAKVQKDGLQNAVVLTGRVPHDQIERYYSLIDIMCYPRLPMRLTELVTPLKPLEAMAQQKLVIASDIGGHLELISDGNTGVLFKAGSARDLADKLLCLLDHREKWPPIVKSARAYIERERSWAASVARYAPVYEALCPNR